jgi:hypothetical protein
MTAGEKVASHAEKYVGVQENPLGSNRGTPYPNAWEKPWGMGYGWPWCGAFAAAMYSEISVDDDGIGSPSTAVMYERAKARGAIVKRPVPGAFILWPGVHVGIVVRDLGNGICLSVEGNSGDGVRYRRRAYADAVLVAPKAVRDYTPVQPARRYYLEDTAAKPSLVGPWRSREARERAIKNFKNVRRVRVGKKYAAYIGPRRVYGPWGDEASRNAARKTLEARLGRKMRPYSRAIQTVPAGAEDMGKVD